MTDDEMAAIRERLNAPVLLLRNGLIDDESVRKILAIVHDAGALLAEVARLRAENTDLIAVAESLVISPNAKLILSDYRAALAAVRAENAALREMAQAVADGRVFFGHTPAGDAVLPEHSAQWVDKARALLARDDERGQQS